MKVNINIKLWDDSSLETLEEVGLTTKFVRTLLKKGIEKWIEDNKTDGCEYSVYVEVME